MSHGQTKQNKEALIVLKNIHEEFLLEYRKLKPKICSTPILEYQLKLEDLEICMEKNIPECISRHLETPFGELSYLVKYLVEYLDKMDKLLKKYKDWKNLPNFHGYQT